MFEIIFPQHGSLYGESTHGWLLAFPVLFLHFLLCSLLDIWNLQFGMHRGAKKVVVVDSWSPIYLSCTSELALVISRLPIHQLDSVTTRKKFQIDIKTCKLV